MPQPSRERANLLPRSLYVLRGLAPHARHHRRWLVQGALAAIFVVVARLALPWPLRAVAERWIDAPPGAGVAEALPASLDPVLGMGAAFLALVLLLGFSDHCARLYFARFAIGTVRDLRSAVFRSVVRAPDGRHARRPGDLISRLVGDTARIKTTLQGFLVHVATNGLTLAGATVIVLSMNVQLGLVFAAASAVTAAISVVVAGQVFRKSLKFRKKEGELADEIQSTIASRNPKRSGLAKLNRSSGRHEASLTRLQGIATWITHGMFGLAMLAALWIGSSAVEAGELPAADMVVFMMYALTMRGPFVRLARQGSRTGKVLGPAFRLVRLQEKAAAAEAKRATRGAEPAVSKRIAQVSRSTRQGSRAARGEAVRILFSGYAPVHFVCFRPLFDRLSALPGVEVFVSGGLRTRAKRASAARRPESGRGAKEERKAAGKKDGEWRYDERALYQPFGVPDEKILSVRDIREQDFDVVFGANTKLILPRSVSTRVQIFHGISFRNKAVRLANMGCDYYFLVGPYMHRLFVETDLLEDGDKRGVSIGFMKTDQLLNGQLDRARLLEEFGLGGERPVLLYAPTGAKCNSLETMGEEVIARLSSSGHYDLLIKPHDHPKNRSIDWFERLSRYEDDHCKVMREPDVTRLLYLADLLLSDASSVTNEYALMDRPVVFLDTPQLLARSREAEESALDLDTWGRRGGVVVERPDEVESAVEESLSDPRRHSEVRRAMAKDFFYNPGVATDAAIAWLREHVLDAR